MRPTSIECHPIASNNARLDDGILLLCERFFGQLQLIEHLDETAAEKVSQESSGDVQ